jgi:hypothetical protein
MTVTENAVKPMEPVEYTSNTSVKQDLRVTVDNFVAPFRFLFRNLSRAGGSVVDAVRGQDSTKPKHV